MRKIVEYDVISARCDGEGDYNYLINRCNELIASGWVPVGGISYVPMYKSFAYVQAIVKYADEEPARKSGIDWQPISTVPLNKAVLLGVRLGINAMPDFFVKTFHCREDVGVLGWTHWAYINPPEVKK